MIVEVTQAHIDEALRRRRGDSYAICKDCAVAIAASEAFGRPMMAGFTTISDEGDVHNYESGAMSQWVTAFDLSRNNLKAEAKLAPITLEFREMAQ